MKILFVIQGEGRGHLTQALSLRQKLMVEGHEIVGVLVGKSPARRLPDFFLDKIQSPVYPFESPNFLPTAKNKQVNLMSSILYNVLRLHKYMGSIRYIDRMIRQTGAGVVADRFDLDALLSISESHAENPLFRHWVRQADWLILREFREDLLREEYPVTSLGRITTNWVARLGRFLPI